MEFGEFVFFAGGDDELFGSESVLDGVAGGAGFTVFGTRAGGEKCVGGVGSRLGGEVIRISLCGRWERWAAQR